MDATTGEMIITLSTPLKHPETDELLGVLGKDISYNSVLDDVHNWQVTDEGYYVIVDNYRTTIMHPDIEQVGMEVPVMEIDKALQDGIMGTFEYTFNGRDKLVNIVRYDPLDLNVLHIDTAPKSEFSIIDLRYIMVFIIGTIIILSMVYQRFTWMRKKVVNENDSQPIAYQPPTQSIEKK